MSLNLCKDSIGQRGLRADEIRPVDPWHLFFDFAGNKNRVNSCFH